MEELKIKEMLIRENEEYRRLENQHQECEQKLRDLHRGNIRTDQEWFEVQDLKKQKLRLKDSMESFIANFRGEQPV